MGLARAFLMAGSGAVAATLWPVEDRASRELFVAFHSFWRDGRPASDALRRALLSAISAGRTPVADWASVQLVGREVRRLGS
jgi:CHAT domain-containing protein